MTLSQWKPARMNPSSLARKTGRALWATAPLLFVLGMSVIEAHAQTGIGTSGNAGLDKASTFFQQFLVWLRGIAVFVFIGSLVWGCIEAAMEGWREGRSKIFTSLGCAIIAGVAQAVISSLYSSNG